MEEFLSHQGIAFELRDLMVEPLTREEMWRLFHDAEGRQLGPITQVGGGLVMGDDLIRLEENLEMFPEARTTGATVYGRPGDRATEAILGYLRERGVPATLHDLDREPLSPEALWTLLEMPGKNIRTPLTDVDGTVVIGNDRRRLEEVLTQAGYLSMR